MSARRGCFFRKAPSVWRKWWMFLFNESRREYVEVYLLRLVVGQVHASYGRSLGNEETAIGAEL